MRETLSGIFVAGELEQRYMNGIRELGVPCIVLDFYSPVYPNNYIHINNFHLGFTAAEYLIGKGHTRIGFVGDVYSTHAVCERYLGYCKALITHKIAANSEWHINMNLEHGAEIDNILPAVLPTAFITHCDSAAQKLYIALRLAGLSVPGDVSIVSFDNTALCKVLNPTLTSVGVDTARFAAKGLESMDKLMKGYAKRINIELPPPRDLRAEFRAYNHLTGTCTHCHTGIWKTAAPRFHAGPQPL